MTWAKTPSLLPQVHLLVISDEFTESKIIVVESACERYD
jgi:hypothetical protein